MLKVFNLRFYKDTSVSIPVEVEKEADSANSALLGTEVILSPERYPTSQFHQFWTVLKRTLLFSRRDWVHILENNIFKLYLKIIMIVFCFIDFDVFTIICSCIGWIFNWCPVLRHW